MLKKFNGITNSIIALSCLAILSGIALVVWPGLSLWTLAIIVGIYFVVHGIIEITYGYYSNKYMLPYDGVTHGLLSVILGIISIVIFAMEPEKLTAYLATVLGIGLGVWVILSSLDDIKVALTLKKVPKTPWSLILVLSILNIIFGLLIIVMPIFTTGFMIIMIGCVLIANGIIRLVDTICLKKKANSLKKAINKNTDQVKDFYDDSVDLVSNAIKSGKDIIQDTVDQFKNI